MPDNTIRVLLKGDSQQLQDALKRAESSLNKLAPKLKDVGRKLTTFVSLPLAGAGAAAIKFASDMEESTNKVDVAFGESSKQVKAFAKNTLESFGIAESSALDMTALFGDMATGMGVSQKEAAKLSTDLVGLAGDLASFKNINIDEVTTALSGVFTGETESLKRLGIVMTEVNLEQFRMSQGIEKSVKQMTQQEKIMLRLQYIFDVTKNAQGDFARTGDSAANQTRKFTEGLKELGASVGEVLLPMFTDLVTKANSLLKEFKDLDESTKENIVRFGLFAAAVPPVIYILGQLADAFSFATRMAKALMSAEAMGGLTKAFKLIGGATGAAVIATIAAAGVAFDKATDKIAPNVGFWEKAGAAISGLLNPLAGVTNLLGANAANASAARQPVQKLASAFLAMKGITPVGDQIAITGETIKHFKPLTNEIQTIQKGLIGVNNEFSGLENVKPVLVGVSQTFDEMTFSFQSMASSIGNALTAVVVNGGSAFAALGQVILGTLGDLLVQMGTAAIAAAELSKTFAIPIVGTAAGIAAVALGTLLKGLSSRVQSGGFTAFANGGIVSTPTLGLVGEYAGARQNPEVIAPLDKLKSMIGDRGGNVNVTGEFRLQGQDLVVALERAGNMRNRTT